MDKDFTRVGDHLAVLRRRGWIIVLAVILGAGVGAFLTPLSEPTYSATAQVLVPGNTDSEDTTQMSTQVALAQSDTVVDQVIDTVDLDTTAADLLEDVVIEAEEGSAVLTFTATRPTPIGASSLANTFARTYLDAVLAQKTALREQTVSSLETELRRVNRQLIRREAQAAAATGAEAIRLNQAVRRLETRQGQLNTDLATAEGPILPSAGGELTQKAVPPPPSETGRLRGILAGIVLGLIVGAAIAYLRDHLDDTVRHETMLVPLLGTIPVLGRIPVDPGIASGGVVTRDEPDSRTADTFRALATNLRYRTPGRPTHRATTSTPARTGGTGSLVVVTSASADEGKTSVATNLALSAAAAGQRVVLVDADLRNPSVAGLLGLDHATAGLVEMLTARTPRGGALKPVDIGVPNLGVVPAGRTKAGSHDLLSTRAAADTWQALRSDADLVILDTAPLLGAADTMSLVTEADQVLLVVMRGSTRLRDLRAGLERLELVRAALAGAVLTKVPTRELAGGYYPTVQPGGSPGSSTGTRSR